MIMIFPTYSQTFFNLHIRNAIVSLIKIIHTHYLIWTLFSNQWLMYLMFFRVLILSSSHFQLISLNWNVPCRTVRRFRPLSLPICRSNYALHDPFRVLCDYYNALCHVLLLDSPNATNYDKLMYFLSSNNL